MGRERGSKGEGKGGWRWIGREMKPSVFRLFTVHSSSTAGSGSGSQPRLWLWILGIRSSILYTERERERRSMLTAVRSNFE